MKTENRLIKNPSKKILAEKHGEYYLILDEETGKIFLSNETSHFLYEKCAGQRADDLCELLFENCIDKETLDYTTVYKECQKALKILLEMGFLITN